MKIAVVGCGAVGSYYGARLGHAGEELHFLLRSDYDAVRRNGVRIRSPQGDFRVRPKCARAPEEIGVCDLVLIGLKTTANDRFPDLLPPLIGPATAVLTLQNGLGNEEQLASFVSSEQILGGLCFVCLNRLEPGLIQHIDHGRVMLGEFRRWPEPRTHDFASLFRRAGVPCTVTDDLARAHWEKLTWNIPFNGLGVAGAAGFEAVLEGQVAPLAPLQPCLTTDKLLNDERWSRLLRELMMEVISAARGLGFDVPVSLVDKQVQRTQTMGAYKASTLIDFERRQPLELKSLFHEPLRQAQSAGVPVPRLAALCRVLEQLDPGAGTSSSPQVTK
ncbi:MAG TPA: 2-dehydropantoate 2-reductase [Verrucomicrobiae bacterium]|nr:2-dehydropantoate 2-reductase [Verrucomicrobiae bacterium]